MKCSNCGNSIQPTDEYCAKCGANLAAEKDSVQDPVPSTEAEDKTPPKKKTVNPYIVALIGVLLVAGIGMVLILSKQDATQASNPNASPSSSPNTAIAVDNETSPTMTATETTSPPSAASTGEVPAHADYSPYIGTWVSLTNSNEQEVYDYGGYVMEVIEIIDDGIVFDLSHISQSGRIGTVDSVVCIIKDNVGSFKYASDSWSNSGQGIVRLEEGRIILTVETLESGENANWDMGSGAIFIKAVERPIVSEELDPSYDPRQEYMERDYELEALVLEGGGRYYAYEELIQLDEYELSIVRNGMYAISGKQFTSNEDAMDFFNRRDWYQPFSTDDDVIIPRMNQYQKANAELVVSIEKQLGIR